MVTILPIHHKSSSSVDWLCSAKFEGLDSFLMDIKIGRFLIIWPEKDILGGDDGFDSI